MQATTTTTTDPHRHQPVLRSGPDPSDARATLILVHGRGATAEGMLGLYSQLDLDNIAAIAPQAASQTWYPQSFLRPLADNQPYLDSALNRIDSLVSELIANGVASERIALLGFSQGACLVSEFAARHPRRYGALLVLSGGLIGPPGTPRNYPGSLARTPTFIGASDPDPWFPFERIEETHHVLDKLGADVELRRYPGHPHSIHQDQVEVCRSLLATIE